MDINSCRPNTIKLIVLLLVSLVLYSPLLAEPEKEKGPVFPLQDEKNFTYLQRTARLYRIQGYELQRLGNIEGALALYQKAVELDPSYSIAYNDLGIIFESKGMIDRAEESYLRAVRADPTFLSAYSNLAVVYENKRDLEKAAFYWQKRAQMGLASDPWTQKARQRLDDIHLVLSDRPLEDKREKEVFGLLKDVENQKSTLRQDDKVLSNKHFEKAKAHYKNANYAAAIKEALDAQQLNPSNKEIDSFIEKAQLRALSR